MGVLSTLGRLFPGFNPAARTAVTAVQPVTSAASADRPRRSYGEKVPAGYGIGTNITFLPYVDSATADTAAIRDAMRQMLRDPWVKTAWVSQLFAVASQDYSVAPHDKKDANAILQAEFTRHWIEELPGGMAKLAMNIMMPLGPDGISVVEPVNAPPAASGRWAGKVMPSKCVARDVNHIRLIGDRFRNITTVKATREPTQPEYPAADFVITQYMPVFGEPFGTAAFRASYSAYWMLDTIRKLRALHHEKRTKGRIVGTYDANSPDEKDQLEAALRQLSASDFAVVPEGVKIEAIAMTTANETDYKSFEQDKQTEIVTGIALASLQILQGNVTDARGDTGVQQETSQLGTWYLQRLVEEAVKQLVKLYIDLNFPSPAGYPKVTLGQVKQSEAKAFLDTIEQAQRLGFDDIDRRKVAEFASLPLATDDADKLKPKPPGGGADPLGGLFGGGGPPPAPPSPGGPPEPMLGDPATFSEQPYQSFAWTAAKTRTGGTKAVGTGRDTGRTLYGKAAAAALTAGGHKADHEGGKEYDSHRDRRAALESRRKRASELTQKLVSYNATPEEHKELVEHLPSLTRKQLSSVRERLMARFGGDTTLAGRVEKLKAHITERATLPTGDTRPEDGRAAALEKRGEKSGAKPTPARPEGYNHAKWVASLPELSQGKMTPQEAARLEPGAPVQLDGKWNNVHSVTVKNYTGTVNHPEGAAESVEFPYQIAQVKIPNDNGTLRTISISDKVAKYAGAHEDYVRRIAAGLSQRGPEAYRKNSGVDALLASQKSSAPASEPGEKIPPQPAPGRGGRTAKVASAFVPAAAKTAEDAVASFRSLLTHSDSMDPTTLNAHASKILAKIPPKQWADVVENATGEKPKWTGRSVLTEDAGVLSRAAHRLQSETLPTEHTLYHGTHSSNVDSIAATGLRASASGTAGSGVYLADSPDEKNTLYERRGDAAGVQQAGGQQPDTVVSAKVKGKIFDAGTRETPGGWSTYARPDAIMAGALLGRDRMFDTTSAESRAKAIKEMRAMGYSGVRFRFPDGRSGVTVFDPADVMQAMKYDEKPGAK